MKTVYTHEIVVYENQEEFEDDKYNRQQKDDWWICCTTEGRNTDLRIEWILEKREGRC